jgi:hypothetical protein
MYPMSPRSTRIPAGRIGPWAPSSQFGRYDDPDKVAGGQLVPRTYQGCFEAIYKY